jgi:hypothetical protein
MGSGNKIILVGERRFRVAGSEGINLGFKAALVPYNFPRNIFTI